MLIKSIEIKNFRQFKNERVDFATGENGKNVTIIMGENGAGKTTLAQAFTWCLYGKTTFPNQSLLNLDILDKMSPGSKEQVIVALEIRHGEADYRLKRELTYTKNYSGSVKSDFAEFSIRITNADGETSWVKSNLCDNEVRNILPVELSKFFFFDGERIEKLSKEIANDKQAADFSDAVEGLLGLNGIRSAIKHFGKNGVIREYEKNFDTASNSKIGEYNKKIDIKKKRLEEIDLELDILDTDIEVAQKTKSDKEVEIRQYADGEKLQIERDATLSRIDKAENAKTSLYKSFFYNFNSSDKNFFSLSLIKRAMDVLVEQDFNGKDIPCMHAKTIEYLLKQKICICGTHLDEGTTPYLKVKDLIDFLPPKSISTMVSDFKKECVQRVDNYNNLAVNEKSIVSGLSEQSENISDLNDDLREIEGKLSGGDVRAVVKNINSIIMECQKTINADYRKRDNLNLEKGGLDTEIIRLDTERSSLALLDKKNKRTQIYLNYAKSIYNELNELYTNSEKEIRQRLQMTINDIFKQIYDGDFKLSIKSNYHIVVSVSSYNTRIDTSTAQSIIVIFAFIASIIKLAKENKDNKNEDRQLLSSESYPLVMDAPLSALDITRIKTTCEALPNIAEQVIIFIKDTDGKVAKEYLASKIGCEYVLKSSKDAVYSTISRGENNV